MDAPKLHSIDAVIEVLEDIIQTSIREESVLGYFASLYQKVTIQVKKGIEEGFFEDGPRMEELDILFASRYIDAYHAWRQKEPVTESWQVAFDLAKYRSPIVLQHLLVGMNAHINLDLGIAAAEVSRGQDIHALRNDFYKINDVLSDLVGEVEEDLSRIWPRLKFILQKTRNVENFMIDFSMEVARNGAWKFASHLAALPDSDFEEAILERDKKVSQKALIITRPGMIVQFLLYLMRIWEKGSVSAKIKGMKRS